jgi:hypothetical protein
MAGMSDKEKRVYIEGFQAAINMIDEEYDGTNGHRAIEKASLYLTAQLELWAEGTVDYPPSPATRELSS